MSLAVVDRATINSHLETSVDDDMWPAIRAQLGGLAFDYYIATDSAARGRWIDQILRAAGVDPTRLTDTEGEPA